MANNDTQVEDASASLSTRLWCQERKIWGEVREDVPIAPIAPITLGK